MSDFSSIAKPSAQDREAVAEQTRAQRESYIKGPNGDLVGNNYTVAKGDFGAFLGYKQPTPQEMAGSESMSGSRVIEVALQKEMAELGEGAAKNGNSYRNIHISWGRYNNEPGREKDMIKDGIDAFREGPDKNSLESQVAKMGEPGKGQSAATAPYFEQLQKFQNASRNDNVKYLEMQYKFMEMSKQTSTISNLMKTRHDALTRTIRGTQ